MKSIFYKIQCVICCGFGILNYSDVYADYAMEHTQLANNAQLLAIAGFAEDELSNVINMLNDMESNSRSLSYHTWGDPLSQLKKLADISAAGSALAYAMLDISQQYRQQMPGYEAYSQQLEGSDDSVSFDFSNQYQRWVTVNEQSIEQALVVLQQHHNEFQTEDEQMATIRHNSQSAMGRMAALQTANELSNQQITQLQHLRQLVMTQIQFVANQAALQQDKMELQYAMEQKYYDQKLDIAIDAGKRYGVITDE